VAYFDLTSAQTASLLYLRERVSTVHVRFAVDALLPSFQQALRFWDGQYAPTAARLRQAILSGHPADAPNAEQQHAIQTIMIQHWAKAQAVVTNVRDVLADDIGYLSMRGAGEEQARWQRRWSEANPPDLLHTITPALGQIPSLTLVFDFPLPPSRQPGRMRRMRRHRARRRHNHSR
jgi:hypothetical protein